MCMERNSFKSILLKYAGPQGLQKSGLEFGLDLELKFFCCNCDFFSPSGSCASVCFSTTLLNCCNEKNFNAVFKTQDGGDDMKKGTQLLEVYALEIQMYTVQKNNKKLKHIYEQSLRIKSAIPHPFTMGVIRGK